MQTFLPQDHRILPTQTLSVDVVIVGGGVAGVCFSIAAARGGAKVILVQDRPDLTLPEPVSTLGLTHSAFFA